MRSILGLAIYRLLLPLLFLAAFPGWLMKMVRRGGIGTRLGERASIYSLPLEQEPCGAVHVHAVSVGETLLALKLLREWRRTEPDRKFVLATGTATGHSVATAAKLAGLRVTYTPLDFQWMVRRYLNRFEPAQIVLIEGEVWPHLLRACRRRTIPIHLVNARLSPRSKGRYLKFARWIQPIFCQLHGVAVQEADDLQVWEQLGVERNRIHVTGSLKFDPGSGPRPAPRPEFQEMLDAFGFERSIVLAASTHAGEEARIAMAIRDSQTQALPAIVPRHAERRHEVAAELQRAGFEVVLRSQFHRPRDPAQACLVVDSTGELRDWTAHANAVVIGKSFLATGGQNPAEAILAHRPLIFGPHMENFEPLASQLVNANGAIRVEKIDALAEAVGRALHDQSNQLQANAAAVLARHDGATRRILELLRKLPA
jgi:3-deoxy-D-manno-octulosonic-acid transferase